MAAERHQQDRWRLGRYDWQRLANCRGWRLQWRRQGRHPVAERQWRSLRNVDEWDQFDRWGLGRYYRHRLADRINCGSRVGASPAASPPRPSATSATAAWRAGAA